MATFLIFDCVLASNIDLPELQPVDTGPADLLFSCHSRRNSRCRPGPWLNQWKDSQGNLSAAYATLPGGFLLAVPHVADFVFRPGDKSIEAFPVVDEPDMATLRHALLDRVIPMCLGHLGWQILHASAVDVEGYGVIAFVGDTGAGKSTLAASFARSGADLVADDCLMITREKAGFRAMSNYPGLRLNDDSAGHLFRTTGEPGSVARYSNKKRLSPAGIGVEPKEKRALPLKGIFLLDCGPSVTVTPAILAQDLMGLVKQHFFLDVRNRDQVSSQFENVKRLVNGGMPVNRLSYPREFETLEQVRRVILAFLREIS